jgi:hypothetical protein
MEENVLFPFLANLAEDEEFDLWGIPSTHRYRERLAMMKWLSIMKVGHWLVYVVMQDFLCIRVLQYWHSMGETWQEIRQRVFRFFYN